MVRKYSLLVSKQMQFTFMKFAMAFALRGDISVATATDISGTNLIRISSAILTYARHGTLYEILSAVVYPIVGC